MNSSMSRTRPLGRRVSRRRFVQGLALGAAGLAIGPTLGCDSGKTGGTTTPRGSASPTVSQPVKGGTLSAVQAADLAPQTAVFTNSPTNYYLVAGVYEKLMHYRSDRLEAVPDLAESWKFSSDYTSLNVKLRSGVKFHTGRPLTSEDVKWSVEQIADPKTGSQLLNFGKWVQKMETPDPLTIVFQFDQARPSFLDTFENLFIADKETYQDTVNGKNFVGTGPFKFKEWVTGDHWTLQRNPDYWRKELPYLDEVVVRVVPEPQTQLINVQTGTADVANQVDPRDAKSVENDPKYKVITNPVFGSIWYLGVDVKAPPFTDKRVRQAMAYLLDRKRIVDTLLFYGTPTVLPWDKASPAYTPELADKYDYNLDKCKELLRQAGVGSDVTVPLTVSAAYVPTHGIAEMIQAELAKLGWKASIDKLQHPEFLQKLTGGKFGGLWVTTCGFVHMTPSTLFVMSFPYRVPNSSNYDTPEYRKLIDDMLNAGDENELKKIYKSMNELLLDECFLIPISGIQSPVVLSAKVQGLAINRSSQPTLMEAWKAK